MLFWLKFNVSMYANTLPTLTDEWRISQGTLNVVVQATVPGARLSTISVKLNSYLARAAYTQITPTVGADYTISGFAETSELGRLQHCQWQTRSQADIIPRECDPVPVLGGTSCLLADPVCGRNP